GKTTGSAFSTFRLKRSGSRPRHDKPCVGIAIHQYFKMALPVFEVLDLIKKNKTSVGLLPARCLNRLIQSVFQGKINVNRIVNPDIAYFLSRNSLIHKLFYRLVHHYGLSYPTRTNDDNCPSYRYLSNVREKQIEIQTSGQIGD